MGIELFAYSAIQTLNVSCIFCVVVGNSLMPRHVPVKSLLGFSFTSSFHVKVELFFLISFGKIV
jgi:hypothetical protein